MAKHPIVHVEIPGKDPKKTAGFYSQVFGWTTEEYPEMNYITFAAEGGPGGGFPQIDGDFVRADRITINIETDNIPATLAQIEKLGGKTVRPEEDIPGIGSFAIFEDPDGNNIALYKPLPHEHA